MARALTVACKIGFVELRLKKFRAKTTLAVFDADTIPPGIKLNTAVYKISFRILYD
jgi:hypothetical protein